MNSIEAIKRIIELSYEAGKHKEVSEKLVKKVEEDFKSMNIAGFYISLDLRRTLITSIFKDLLSLSDLMYYQDKLVRMAEEKINEHSKKTETAETGCDCLACKMASQMKEKGENCK